MKDIFTDRVAVVTGAGGGIGRALSLALAQRGAKLALCDIEADAVEATARAARDMGVEAIAHRLDISDRDAVIAYGDTVLSHFGRVNHLYNNAGISAGNEPFAEVPWDRFDRVMGVNLGGVVSAARVFLPHLIASGDGHMVTISSLNGLMAQPHMSSYVTSKFAVRGLTEAIRQEMIADDHPVEVTVVHPGGVATEIAARRAPEIDSLPPEKQAAARKRLKIYQDVLLKMRPEDAATEILTGMAKGKRRIVLTRQAKQLDFLVRVLPTGYVPIVARKMRDLFG